MSEWPSAQVVGMHDLERRLPEFLDRLASEGQELIVTRDGEPAAVIVDFEHYREVQQALKEFADPEYLAVLLEARQDIDAGRGISAAEVFAEKGL
ncbi:MAG TPA: type II toxin-antitoxin system prevent-host-death family antitoxin [Chloroflexota bacterium]|nr:type II toxin-antitoxin system prevent-host-death family antitoxin [Chloroflexota bacterium]